MNTKKYEELLVLLRSHKTDKEILEVLSDYHENDIAAAPLLQALIFQMDYRHVVYVGYFNKMLSLLQFADSALQFIVGVCHLRACRGKLQFGVKP